MIKRIFVALFLPLLSLHACVRPKLYRAELEARSASEGREKVLGQELADRKTETAKLTEEVGSLNRVVGNQEAEINRLNKELEERIQQMGKSASIMTSEKMTLEKELVATRAELALCRDTLHQIQQARQQYTGRLDELQGILAAALRDQESSGVTVTVTGDAVTLLLPDKLLFDAKGLDVTAAAKSVLTTLAILLTSRPELDAEVVSYTDNVLPNRVLKDTWSWSLVRAVNVVRALVQEYNVNANQLSPVGRGEFYPLTSNETPEGRQQNRRTVIVLHPAK